MSDYTTTNAPKQTRQQCRHVLVSGHRCQSPCLRAAQSGHHEPFCYYHHTSRRPAPHRHMNRLQTGPTLANASGHIPFVLPHIEDFSSIQAAVNDIVLRVTLGELDRRSAGILLYAMQISALTLRASQASTQPQPRNSSRTRNIEPEPEIPTVEEVIDDPDLGLIAPIALYKEPEDRIPHKPSRWRRLLDELDKAKADEAAQAKAAEEAAREQAEEPAPTILPILQAQSALRGRRPLRGVWKLRAALPLAGHNLQLRPSGAPPRSGSKVTK